jgi:hypothetical protein
MAINFPDAPSVDDVFVSGNSTWVWNGTTWSSTPSAVPLNTLSDVTITSAVNGEVVQYDGSGWVNADIIAQIVDSAPATLDTLNELAAALGDDANFATTVTASLSGKASSSHTHLLAEITDYVEPDALPDQTSNTGKYLTTDGSVASWGVVDVSGYVSQTNGVVTTASTSSAVVRNITLSTSEPTGGIDGDVWLTY